MEWMDGVGRWMVRALVGGVGDAWVHVRTGACVWLTDSLIQACKHEYVLLRAPVFVTVTITLPCCTVSTEAPRSLGRFFFLLRMSLFAP